MRVEPEGRVVLAVLGELARLVDHLSVLGSSPLVRFTHDGAALDHERQVLQARAVARVSVWFECLVEEELRAAGAVRSEVEPTAR